MKPGKRRLIWVLVPLIGAGMLLGARSSTPDMIYDTVPVGRHDIEAVVTAIGSLQPRHYVDVGAQVSGQITRLHVQPGSPVRRGALLVEIDPSVQQAEVDAGRAALAGLHAQRAEQVAQQRLARLQYARQQQLRTQGMTSQAQVDITDAERAMAQARIHHLDAQIRQTQATLKADEARLGYTRIYAPMDGTVVSVVAREGQTLNATYQTPPILRIADLSTMTVWTEVSEADIGRVERGQAVHFDTLGGSGRKDARRWHGRVRQILPAPTDADPQAAGTSASRAVSFTVLFDVDNDDGALRPDMTAQVSIVTASVRDVPAVPLGAVDTDADGRARVRVLDATGKVEERVLQLGVRDRHLAQVRAGLLDGDAVITAERQAPSLFEQYVTW